MLKNIFLSLLMAAVFSGCGNNEKKQENTLLDSVKSVHDKVMDKDVKAVQVRKKLKALLAKKPALKDSVGYFLKMLDDNDKVMTDWMNKFDPDFTGKSHEQIVGYLKIQRKKVADIDSQLKQELDQAIRFCIRNN